MYMYVPFPTRKAYLTTINHANFCTICTCSRYSKILEEIRFLLTRVARENYLNAKCRRRGETRGDNKFTRKKEREKEKKRNPESRDVRGTSGRRPKFLGCINDPPLITQNQVNLSVVQTKNENRCGRGA